MDKSLLIAALARLAAGIVLLFVILFVPAGSFTFWNAWLLIALVGIPMTLAGVVLFFKAPELLKKRFRTNESEKTQKLAIALSGLLFLAVFITAGFDFRFAWSNMPLALVVAVSIVFLLAYALNAEVMRENAFLSRSVEIQEGQKLVDTGLYGIVRHPFYLSNLILFTSMPLILGSYYAWLISLGFIYVFAIRINNEEEVLERNLTGYVEYKTRVKYKVIPYLW